MSRPARTAIFLAAGAGLGLLLLWGYAGLPDFGHYRGPYGFVLDRVATPERHIANVVNATTYDYRGFDTLGEEFILFAAVTGVVLLLRGEEGEQGPGDVVRARALWVLGILSVGAVVLVGLWLVAFGFVTPGGGFQGGVAIAAGIVLVYLASSYRVWSAFGTETLLDPIEGVGAGGFVVVGLAALVSGMPFLTNLLGPGTTGTLHSGGSAPFVNWAAGIEVAAALLVLFAVFIDAHLVPIARSTE